MEVNYLAIFIAALSSMVVGSIWFGSLFSKTWMSLTKVSQKDIKKTSKKETYKMYLTGYLVEVAVAYALYIMGTTLKLESVLEWMKLGFLTGFFFVGASTLSGYLWERKPFKLWILYTGATALSLTVMGMVLALV